MDASHKREGRLAWAGLTWNEWSRRWRLASGVAEDACPARLLGEGEMRDQGVPRFDQTHGMSGGQAEVAGLTRARSEGEMVVAQRNQDTVQMDYHNRMRPAETTVAIVSKALTHFK